ncbi:MAG: NAD-dependent protein deacylase, partial [Clostridia bacterium]|nr:NAD-dependent protein deacylase [Clostridia bacterium]
LSAVITQNIDGLHQQAGSKRVIELHGSVERNYCTRCHREYSRDFIIDGAMSIGGVPRCECGGTVRPDVTLYGEALDTEKFYDAEELIAECELLIVGGTSLTVNPAASLIEAYMGERLVIINKSPTPYDDMAYLIIRENIEDVLSELV